MSPTWPECPTHPNTHPLEAAVLSDRAVWRCPKSGDAIAEIGTLQGDPDPADLDTEEYESVTGVSKVEYETALLEAAQRSMGGPLLDGDVQSVTLDHEESTLVVVFTSNRARPRIRVADSHMASTPPKRSGDRNLRWARCRAVGQPHGTR